MSHMFTHYHFRDLTKMVANTTLSRNPNKIPTGPLKGNGGNALFMGIPP